MPASVIAIGDTTVDIFLHFLDNNQEIRVNDQTREFCVKYGEKIDVDSCVTSIGGNAANVAVGLSRLGVSTALAAEIGNDGLSALILSGLQKENIDNSFLLQTPDKSASLSVGINFNGDRTIFTDRPVKDHSFAFEKMQDTKLIFLTSLGLEWKHVYEQTLRLIEEKQIPLAFNPGSLQLHGDKDLLHRVVAKTTVLFVNKEEAEQLLFGQEPEKSSDSDEYVNGLLEKLTAMGAKMCVITNGSHGVYVLDEAKKHYFLPAAPVAIVEKTGAGDAFTAGFLAAWYTGLSIEKAMQWGVANSASVIGKVGAQAGLLKLNEITNYKLQITNSNMLYILPFDHRHTFAEKLYHVETLSPEQDAEIREFKQIIYDAFVASVTTGGLKKEDGAILVDEQYGDAVLRNAKLDGYTTILTIEKSGGTGLEFAYGEDFAAHIERYKPDYTKILIRYNPDNPQESKQQQIEKLKIVSDYSREHGYKFLLEPLIPATPEQLTKVNNDKNAYDVQLRPDLTVKMMQELQTAGVVVDIWKLEGFDAKEAYEKCVVQARSTGKTDVGIVVLGRGAGEETVDTWLRVGAGVDGVVGFAVGRTVFWDAIAAYHAKVANREETVKIISDNFTHFCKVFEEGRKA